MPHARCQGVLLGRRLSGELSAEARRSSLCQHSAVTLKPLGDASHLINDVQTGSVVKFAEYYYDRTTTNKEKVTSLIEILK